MCICFADYLRFCYAESGNVGLWHAGAGGIVVIVAMCLPHLEIRQCKCLIVCVGAAKKKLIPMCVVILFLLAG